MTNKNNFFFKLYKKDLFLIDRVEKIINQLPNNPEIEKTEYADRILFNLKFSTSEEVANCINAFTEQKIYFNLSPGF